MRVRKLIALFDIRCPERSASAERMQISTAPLTNVRHQCHTSVRPCHTVLCGASETIVVAGEWWYRSSNTNIDHSRQPTLGKCRRVRISAAPLMNARRQCHTSARSCHTVLCGSREMIAVVGDGLYRSSGIAIDHYAVPARARGRHGRKSAAPLR